MTDGTLIPMRGFLIHFSHYSPRWIELKYRESPFDLDVGLEIVDTLAEVGFNLLVIDCEDGVVYPSHPELARKHSVPIAHLERLAHRARDKGMEVVPKLNFSQSSYHRHNDWFKPYTDLFDSEEYWQVAFEVIDDIIRACRPQRYFHIGMDEDHDRAHSQYVEAIVRLWGGLKERGLRTILWNDSAHRGKWLVHAEKSRFAEKKIPKDIVQVLWDYTGVQPRIVRRLVREGFEVWGAPGTEVEQVLKWRQVILRHGGKGLLMTVWRPCLRSNRSQFLQLIRSLGPLYSGSQDESGQWAKV